MKKTFLFFLTLSIFGCSKELYPELSEKNLNKYIGKEISVFLSDFNNIYNNFYFRDEPPGKLTGGVFHYEYYSITIYISTHNYVQFFDEDRNWSFNDFLKEKIWYFNIIIK